MNSAGIAALVIVLLAWLSGMVVGFLVIANLAARRWKAAGMMVLVFMAIAFMGAWAGELGVNHGHWNELIAARSQQ